MHLGIRILPVVLALSLSPVPISTSLAAQTSPASPQISQFVGSLADQPPTHLGFVLDRSMLQAARGVLESNGMTPERAAAALSSISYDNYRYAHPAAYTPGTMASIAAAYQSAGWKHLVNAHEPTAGAPQIKGTATDLWLHFTGPDIDGITVMTRGSRDVNLIQVACDLRPLDLLHLSGHFGIPKLDSNAVMVPAPDRP
jgi:hypothetical protein